MGCTHGCYKTRLQRFGQGSAFGSVRKQFFVLLSELCGKKGETSAGELAEILLIFDEKTLSLKTFEMYLLCSKTKGL
jgi:hypothetical protein